MKSSMLYRTSLALTIAFGMLSLSHADVAQPDEPEVKVSTTAVCGSPDLAKAVPKFRPLVLVLENGRILTGFEHVRLSSEKTMLFVDPLGKRMKIARSDIELQRAWSNGMPKYFRDVLNDDEVNNLVAALSHVNHN